MIWSPTILISFDRETMEPAGLFINAETDRKAAILKDLASTIFKAIQREANVKEPEKS